MKNILKSLVLIWLSSLAVPAFASDLFAPVDTIEKMYIGKHSSNKSDDSDDYYDYEQTPNSASTTSVSVENLNVDVAKTTKTKRKKDKTPRLKRIYVAGYAGYFYTPDDMKFSDTQKCNGSFSADFICRDGKDNPINVKYKDDYFLSAAFGINSENPLRIELSYFGLGKDIQMDGMNQVGMDTRSYQSFVDLRGGTVNVYFDFVANRRKPYFVFVPYVMAGIGASEIELGDMTFSSTTANYSLAGKTQRNKTVVFGAGISAGLNNYISLDIGYRYYDFGTVETGDTLTATIPDTTGTGADTVEYYDLQLETELKAHIATIGLKFQI